MSVLNLSEMTGITTQSVHDLLAMYVTNLTTSKKKRAYYHR